MQYLPFYNDVKYNYSGTPIGWPVRIICWLVSISFYLLILIIQFKIYSATYCCLRCLTPNYEFNRKHDESTMVPRTSAGTHLHLQQIHNCDNTKKSEELKKKYGLNGVKSAFLMLPRMGQDFPNCLVPGMTYTLQVLQSC